MNKIIAGILMTGLLVAGCGSPQSSDNPVAPTTVKAARNEAPNSRIAAGVRHLEENQPTEAIKSFVEAIKENPRDVQGYLILGQTYMRLGNFDRALDTLGAATQIAPEHGEVFYLMAMNYAFSGNEPAAKTFAEKSLAIFQQQKDEKNFKRALGLLQSLDTMPKGNGANLPSLKKIVDTQN